MDQFGLRFMYGLFLHEALQNQRINAAFFIHNELVGDNPRLVLFVEGFISIILAQRHLKLSRIYINEIHVRRKSFKVDPIVWLQNVNLNAMLAQVIEKGLVYFKEHEDLPKHLVHFGHFNESIGFL